MKRTVIILAGNFKEFQNYIDSRNQDENRFIYASDQHSIAGLRADRIYIIGSFWDRKDADSLYEYAKAQFESS